jgi:hypothetical protein
MSTATAMQLEDTTEDTIDQYVPSGEAHLDNELQSIIPTARRARQLATERYINGLATAGAYVKLGRKLYIHRPSFRRWVKDQRTQ